MSEDFFLKKYEQLIGKIIVKIARSVEEDGTFYGLVFNDDTVAWILCDPEGNGPGCLDI